MNTGLGLGKPPSEGWINFYNFIKRSPDAKVGALISRGTKHLTDKEIAAYDAPHPDYESKVARISWCQPTVGSSDLRCEG
jgi:haloalkane dehalogenase